VRLDFERGDVVKKIKRVFDRIARFDERSRDYPVRRLLASDAVPIDRVWPCSVVLDQGTEGACTGFGTAHEIAAEPIAVPGINADIARQIYYSAREYDEFPGEDYEGSTVLGAAIAAREMGYYDEFRWAFSVDEIILAVGHQGPVIIGSTWFDQMSTLDRQGYVWPKGRKSGGHCWLLLGWSLQRDAGLLLNSWGPKWGKNGRAWITRKSLKRLASDGGEACVPVIRKTGTKKEGGGA
jgi:hypothetical protein